MQMVLCSSYRGNVMTIVHSRFQSSTWKWNNHRNVSILTQLALRIAVELSEACCVRRITTAINGGKLPSARAVLMRRQPASVSEETTRPSRLLSVAAGPVASSIGTTSTEREHTQKGTGNANTTAMSNYALEPNQSIKNRSRANEDGCHTAKSCRKNRKLCM